MAAATDEIRGSTVFRDLGLCFEFGPQFWAPGAVLPANAFVANSSTGLVAAPANSPLVIGANRENAGRTQGIDTRPLMLGRGRCILTNGAIALVSGQNLKSGYNGVCLPFVDSSLAGAAIGSGVGGNFGNQPLNDSVQVLSSAAGDTTQVATIYGTTTGTNTVVSQTVALNGTTPVTSAKTNWGKILGVSIAGTIAGTVTVRKMTGAATITTLAPATNPTSGIIALSPAKAAYATVPTASANAATTSQVGLVGTDPTGAALLDSIPLSGAANVQLNSVFLTVASVLVGDVPSTVTATVTVSAIRDPAAYLCARAMEAANPGALVEVMVGNFSPENVTPSTLGSTLNQNLTFGAAYFLFEGAVVGITSGTTQTQAGATQLTAQTNRIDTNATAGNGVKLPASAPGLEVTVHNNTANALQVYGLGADTINGQTSTVGITMPPFAVDIFIAGAAGSWAAEVGVGYSGSFPTELSANAITAFAGGGQASATQLTAVFNRVTTVASIGDSVRLPASAAGLDIIVINRGANSLQLFAMGADTIDGAASAAGISVMPNSVVLCFCVLPGVWETEGSATGFGGTGLQTLSFANNLTATGANQAGALQLAAMQNRVTTTAAGTGVLLPPCVAGLVVSVTNRGANPLQVYGNGTDTINGVAAATGVAIPPNSVLSFSAEVAGVWETDGVGQGFAGQLPTVSTTNAITAFAGGGQGSAVLLTTVLNRVTVVGSANDSVKLQPAVAGLQQTVYNAAAANSLNVFPSTGDAINALAANAAFAVAAGKNATFGSPVAGQWHAILSA